MNRSSFAGREVAVEVVRVASARRMTLRADAVRGTVRVAVPPRVRLADAHALVAAHRDWIAARVAHWPAAVPFAPGAVIPFDGGTLRLDWAAGRPARARREGDHLLLGGDVATVAGRTRRWLERAALADLARATAALAATLGQMATVGIGDPAGRWGSCSTVGRIRYSWRLILAPPAVRQSVVAHEVAHLVHPNHRRDFWALATRLTTSDLATARTWLKANGAALHWVGRDC